GRAAKRMSETSNKEAKTIHRLLEMGYATDSEELVFLKDEEDPIKADVVIVDEVSMVDIVLMYSLLKAIKPGTRFILVGDSDQLPSVGAGNVLKDIIDSKVINVVRLNEIFR
ncbi:AAA family ATPase, partial [Paraclostridium sordellii]